MTNCNPGLINNWALHEWKLSNPNYELLGAMMDPTSKNQMVSTFDELVKEDGWVNPITIQF
jgi:hypothetical protein